MQLLFNQGDTFLKLSVLHKGKNHHKDFLFPLVAVAVKAG